jgi:hypothetical protein
MIAPLTEAGRIQDDGASVAQTSPLIDERDDCPAIEQRDPRDRKLRNRIILGNMVAWIMIIMLVRYVMLRS